MPRPWKYVNTDILRPNDPSHVSPHPLDPLTIYLSLNGDGKYFYAKYKCPCGCGATHCLDITPGCDPATKHKWTATVDASGLVTFNPSVNYLCGCRSHYWIRNGEVVWT